VPSPFAFNSIPTDGQAILKYEQQVLCRLSLGLETWPAITQMMLTKAQRIERDARASRYCAM
jgi:hypothetical protein